MSDVKNKQGELLGTYTPINVTEYKPDTLSSECTNKEGTPLTKVVEITKAKILGYATKAINTDIRNYVAGLARPKKGSQQEKLQAYEAFFKEKGFDVSGIPPDKLIATLEEIKQAE